MGRMYGLVFWVHGLTINPAFTMALLMKPIVINPWSPFSGKTITSPTRVEVGSSYCPRSQSQRWFQIPASSSSLGFSCQNWKQPRSSRQGLGKPDKPKKLNASTGYLSGAIMFIFFKVNFCMFIYFVWYTKDNIKYAYRDRKSVV